MTDTHLAFSLPRTAIRNRILIPKYYDPDLEVASQLASAKYELKSLESLLLPGPAGSRLGSWIRRENYGTGDIPFVRTSDLSHWRIRPDFKKGVSEAVYDALKDKQDARPWDILMVAHGTYLVGSAAIVAPGEERMVLQDHVFRLRVNPATGIHPLYLLAALSTAFVRRQVRARQFSADIIDKIGERHLELLIPVSKDDKLREQVVAEVAAVLKEQSDARAEIKMLTGSELRMTRERATAKHGFSITRTALKNRILIPKYYDPEIEADLAACEAAAGEPWVSIGELVASGKVSVGTGVEVGKMAYGTGDIPFLRTSDIADLEVKRDTRHSVGQAVYDRYAKKAALQQNDILLVRDGTYLVGSSALVGSDDLPALFCGGMFRLRVKNGSGIQPSGLLAALNHPLVRRQMRARQFTRDVIDTLGNRLLEVRVPSPSSAEWNAKASALAEVMATKADVKARIGKVVSKIEPEAPAVLSGRPSWSMR